MSEHIPATPLNTTEDAESKEIRRRYEKMRANDLAIHPPAPTEKQITHAEQNDDDKAAKLLEQIGHIPSGTDPKQEDPHRYENMSDEDWEGLQRHEMATAYRKIKMGYLEDKNRLRHSKPALEEYQRTRKDAIRDLLETKLEYPSDHPSSEAIKKLLPVLDNLDTCLAEELKPDDILSEYFTGVKADWNEKHDEDPPKMSFKDAAEAYAAIQNILHASKWGLAVDNVAIKSLKSIAPVLEAFARTHPEGKGFSDVLAAIGKGEESAAVGYQRNPDQYGKRDIPLTGSLVYVDDEAQKISAKKAQSIQNCLKK